MDRKDVRVNDQQQKGAEVTRSSGQERGISQSGPFGFGISPADFFRMGPFSLMRRMNEEMGRMFGLSGDGGNFQPGWMPAIEVRQDEGRMKITAELPGMKPEDVNIELSNDAVIIQGERREERKEDQQGMHLTERRYGHFYRAIPLPEGVKSDQVRANFNNGLLEIDVPMEARQSPTRKIPIQSSGQQQPSSNKAA